MRSFGSTLDDETVASRLRLNGVNAMPRYEFLCEQCSKPFELIMTISEREKTKPTCPTCKGTEVIPQFSGFMAQTGKKS
jgi:putative FmdB family regulatory protein